MSGINSVAVLITVILYVVCVVVGWFLAPDIPRWLVAILAGNSLLNIVAMIIKGIAAN